MRRSILALSACFLSATPAFAHLDPVAHGSLAAGFSHPLFGVDHILAMVGVGLWATLLGGRAVWLVPSAFIGAMLAGFGAAMSDVGLPFVEPTIAASVMIIGLLVAVTLRVPVRLAMTMVGFFALFHGHAHGAELGGAGAWPFLMGFGAATTLLHAVGLGFGLGIGRSGGGKLVMRTAGVLTAFGGAYLLVGA